MRKNSLCMTMSIYDGVLQGMSGDIVSATLEVYSTAMNNLLPTPTKSHYTFNPRDISRVVQGLLMVKPETLGKGAAAKDYYLRLWSHEVAYSQSPQDLNFLQANI